MYFAGRDNLSRDCIYTNSYFQEHHEKDKNLEKEIVLSYYVWILRQVAGIICYWTTNGYVPIRTFLRTLIKKLESRWTEFIYLWDSALLVVEIQLILQKVHPPRSLDPKR